MLGRSGVINTNLLARSQRRRHRLASGVNNVSSRAESETYRALLAPNDNRLAGRICTYRARLVSCACCCLRCGRWSVRCCCFFGRGGAGLCKRQWRNQSADQSNDCSFHSMPPCYLRLPPQFVTHSSSGRFLCVNLLSWLVMRRFEVFAISVI